MTLDGLRAAVRSTLEVARLARGHYLTDAVKFPYRAEFGTVWASVDWVPGWFHEGSAAVLFGVMKAGAPGSIVEIGSYLGRSTTFFALSLRALGLDGQVVAVDPHTGDRQHLEGLGIASLPSLDLFQLHCRAVGVDDLVVPKVTTSLEAAAEWSGPIDVLFVDGWHSYQAVIDDGRAWLPHLAENAVAMFDDYAAYEEVRTAVEQLAAEGTFHLWGSIFGQAIGGAQPTPPPAVSRALRLAGLGRIRSLTTSDGPARR